MRKLIENIQLDFRSGTPIYTQIVEQVKQQVVSGELKPGDQLPTVRALALELRVNFNTAGTGHLHTRCSAARTYRQIETASARSSDP